MASIFIFVTLNKKPNIYLFIYFWKKIMIYVILAMDEANGIGRDNTIPWHSASDVPLHTPTTVQALWHAFPTSCGCS
jgi:hypothetical protein